jgi:RNA polymerase sigma-32 factor
MSRLDMPKKAVTKKPRPKAAPKKTVPARKAAAKPAQPADKPAKPAGKARRPATKPDPAPARPRRPPQPRPEANPKPETKPAAALDPDLVLAPDDDGKEQEPGDGLSVDLEEITEEVDAEPEVVEEKIGSALAVSGRGAIARVSPLQRYLSEVRKHPLLTREEEQRMAEAFYKQGDLDAARRLVSGNLRLVVKIALEYYRHWMDLLDLIQEGNLGLVQAVKKFDPYRGIRLSTYSSFWIRAYILKFLMDNWRLVKIGTTQAQRKLFFNLKKEKERLEQLGFAPGARMLAQALDVKESEVVEMEQRLAAHDESIDGPISEDSKQTREMVLADEQPDTDTVVADDEFARLIRHKLAAFRERLSRDGLDKDLFIFEHRLMSERPLTLQEVGEKFGVSRERVRQLEARLLKNLKEHLKQEMPDYEDYDFVQ